MCPQRPAEVTHSGKDTLVCPEHPPGMTCRRKDNLMSSGRQGGARDLDCSQGGPLPRGRGRPRTRPPESPRSQLTLAPGCGADPVGVLTTPTIPPAPPDLKRVLDPRGGPVVGGTQASEPPGPGPRARNSTTLRAKTGGTGDKEREGKLGGKGQ